MLQIVWILLAVVSFLYGLLILSLASGTRFFAVWFVISTVFCLLAVADRINLWHKLPAVGRGWILAVVIVGGCIFVLTEARIIKSFGMQGEPDLDYVIVLGAQVRDNGPSVVLQYRLDAAYEYLISNEETICIVSGGQGYNEPFSEAEGMKAYLIGKGISDRRILMEAESHTTKENIRNSMTLLDPESDRVGIVTNNFHLYRGCGIARKSGISHVCGICAESKPLYLANNLLREFFGVVKDKLAGDL